jgi:predicted ribosome quality control (RQC) complex YloA/Tae2 family protein
MTAADDSDAGVCQGRSVARRFVSPDGLIVLVGRDARANDLLTFHLAAPDDFWLHVAGTSGSHVVVRNPEGRASLPRDTLRFAAALAVSYSRVRRAGRVAVHVARRSDVTKHRRAPDGEVTVLHARTVYSDTETGCS